MDYLINKIYGVIMNNYDQCQLIYDEKLSPDYYQYEVDIEDIKMCEYSDKPCNGCGKCQELYED